MNTIKKIGLAGLTAVTLAGSIVATPASAQGWRHGFGPGAEATGLAAGSIATGAYGYGYGRGYGPYDGPYYHRHYRSYGYYGY
jgi:hypothetical protein